MKRFHVLMCGYHESSGWHDHVGSADTLEEARENLKQVIWDKYSDWRDRFDHPDHVLPVTLVVQEGPMRRRLIRWMPTGQTEEYYQIVDMETEQIVESNW